MSAVHLPYVDSALAHLDRGGPASWWHHLHWGLYDDPAGVDDSPEAYLTAATALALPGTPPRAAMALQLSAGSRSSGFTRG